MWLRTRGTCTSSLPGIEFKLLGSLRACTWPGTPGDRCRRCARSVFASTRQPDRVLLHVIVDNNTAVDIQDALRCSLSTETRFHVYPFELQR